MSPAAGVEDSINQAVIPWTKCLDVSQSNFCLGLKGTNTFLGSGDGCFSRGDCHAGVIGTRQYGVIDYIMFVPTMGATGMQSRSYFTMSLEYIDFENGNKFLTDTSFGSRHSMNDKTYIVGSVSANGMCSTYIQSGGKSFQSFKDLNAGECSQVQDVNGMTYNVFTFSSSRRWPNDEDDIVISGQSMYVYLFDIIQESVNDWDYRFLISLPSRARIFQKDHVRNDVEGTSEFSRPELLTDIHVKSPDTRLPQFQPSMTNPEKTHRQISETKQSTEQSTEEAKDESANHSEQIAVLSFSIVFQVISLVLTTLMAFKGSEMRQTVRNFTFESDKRRKPFQEPIQLPLPVVETPVVVKIDETLTSPDERSTRSSMTATQPLSIIGSMTRKKE